MSIRDRESEAYGYAGQSSPAKDSYVLIFDPNKQTCTLEPLATSFSFNLKSTPSESSASALSQKYPPIPTEEEEAAREPEDLFDEEDESGPSSKNPFDFRHFVDQPMDRGISRSPTPSGRVDSPRMKASTIKPAATSEAPIARVKPVSKPQVLKQKAKKTSAPTPTVRLERRASNRPVPKKTAPTAAKPKAPPKSAEFVRDTSSSPSPEPQQETQSQPQAPTDDSDPDPEPLSAGGGLEIDFGDVGPPVKKSAVLRGTPLLGSTEGPISLRSAANSPRSLGNTPRVRSGRFRRDEDKGLEIDFGKAGGYREDEDEDEDDDEAERRPSRAVLETHHEVDEDDPAGDEDDVDVEPMVLGSPAHADVQPPRGMGEVSGESPAGEGEAEDEDDMEAAFEAEMMQGLEDDEDESEVSEAE